ncbi:LORF2 protein, partial [Crocuta crocuta]
LWKIIWEFFTKLIIKLPYHSESSLLGINTKELKMYVFSKTCTGMFITASLIIAEKWKKFKSLSAHDLLNKICYIHAMEYYSAIKRIEELTHATKLEKLENIIPSQRSQSQRTTYSIIPFI